MNERKIYRIAEFLADDIESEAGPKVGPVQKAVPVAVGVSASQRVAKTFSDKHGKSIKVDDIVGYSDKHDKEQSGNVVDINDNGMVVIENDDGEEIEILHKKVSVHTGKSARIKTIAKRLVRK